MVVWLPFFYDCLQTARIWLLAKLKVLKPSRSADPDAAAVLLSSWNGYIWGIGRCSFVLFLKTLPRSLLRHWRINQKLLVWVLDSQIFFFRLFLRNVGDLLGSWLLCFTVKIKAAKPSSTWSNTSRGPRRYFFKPTVNVSDTLGSFRCARTMLWNFSRYSLNCMMLSGSSATQNLSNSKAK